MDDTVAPPLPPGLHLLREPGFADPDDPHRPNRLCLCLSDLHFTDGTVGNQSADAVVWESVFENLMDLCVNEEAAELHLILAGDVVDMLRTSRWAEAGIFPWDRDSERYRNDPRFRADFENVLVSIMEGIIARHAQPPAEGRRAGFFHLLRQLPAALRRYSYANALTGSHRTSRIDRVNVVALLGNHDKEVLVSGKVLGMFYEQCLGRPLDPDAPNGLSPDYRRWVGSMYFNDEQRFAGAAPEQTPWTPFYWGDRGFRLLVTHGHWRDGANSRSVKAGPAGPGWCTRDGWRLADWQARAFAPFTLPCWGDTVVTGFQSGFSLRSARILADLEREIRAAGEWAPAVETLFHTLRRVLDEMDLYRPTATATKRVLQLTAGLRAQGPLANRVRHAIETELFNSLHSWLNLGFSVRAATPAIRLVVRAGRAVLNILHFFNRRSNGAGYIDLKFAYALIACVGYLQQFQRNAPSLAQMRTFAAFLDEYRRYGFRIHSEGHTHIPLQQDLYFSQPARPGNRQNYTYVNFGTWRDQVKPTQHRKYRRFGIGRVLVVLDKAGPAGRDYGYYVQDVVNWRDKADAWDRG